MRSVRERTAHLFFALCALTTAALLLLLTVYVVLSGLPGIQTIGVRNFLLGRVWDAFREEDPQFGILPLLLTSACGAAGAAALGVPLGILTALFLARAAPAPVAAVLRWLVELLAGVPSVVCGLVGMTVLVPLLQERLNLPAGDSLLAAVIVLAVMLLPTVVSVSETALAAVPGEYEEASLALGATETETWFHVTLPAARGGVAAAAALGIGRALGETMAILMVAGNVANMPSLLGSVRFLTTGIAMELSYAPAGSLQQQALFSIALVLFAVVLAINILLSLLMRAKGGGA